MAQAIAPGILASEFSGSPWPPPDDEIVRIVVTALRGWYLDHAWTLVAPDYPNGAFAALAIVSAYFETMGRLDPGPLSPKEPECRFRRGLQQVFPSLCLTGPEFLADTADVHLNTYINQMVKILWSDMRNGIYHESNTRSMFAVGRRDGVTIIEFSLTYLVDDDRRLRRSVRRLSVTPDGMTREPWPEDFDHPPKNPLPRVTIDPHELVPHLQRHFERYATALEADPELRGALCNAFNRTSKRFRKDERRAGRQIASVAHDEPHW